MEKVYYSFDEVKYFTTDSIFHHLQGTYGEWIQLCVASPTIDDCVTLRAFSDNGARRLGLQRPKLELLYCGDVDGFRHRIVFSDPTSLPQALERFKIEAAIATGQLQQVGDYFEVTCLDDDEVAAVVRWDDQVRLNHYRYYPNAWSLRALKFNDVVADTPL